MNNNPEIIYLIQGEYDGERGLVWCDDPAPDEHCDPDEAVKYVRADVLEAKAMQVGIDYSQAHILRKQADEIEKGGEQ